MHAIPERLTDASRGGAIQIDYLYLFTFIGVAYLRDARSDWLTVGLQFSQMSPTKVAYFFGVGEIRRRHFSVSVNRRLDRSISKPNKPNSTQRLIMLMTRRNVTSIPRGAA